MDVGRFVVEAHLKEGRPVGELAKAYGVHRSWIYKLLARHRREGPAGLEPRSRRPRRSPTRIADRFEDEVVETRKQLLDAGFDAGAQTIYAHLARRHAQPPSVPTIWRILRRRGFVTPQPHKRPKSSYHRFCAELPNECWQADATHVALADGSFVEILNVIDDHSRLCVAARVFKSVRAADVVRTLHTAGATWGYPASVLTDNGSIFTAFARGGEAAMEAELLLLGITTKHSRPYHPQTCGKVERFHQTMKKYLERHGPAFTQKQLQGLVDRFVVYYNDERPHRSLARRTPRQAWDARGKAVPSGPKIDCAGYRVRRDKVDRTGKVTIRYRSRLHHVGVGRQFAGHRVLMLIAGREVRILTADGRPIRRPPGSDQGLPAHGLRRDRVSTMS